MPELKTFTVEGAGNLDIFYRNFSGTENPYNKPGERNFCVSLSDDMAEAMSNDGWAVKIPEPGEDEGGKRPFIKVKVGYKIRPPKVVMITESATTDLTEETIGVLDWANIQIADLIAQQSHWTYAGKTGISAYLKTMFVTVEEDALERKYAILLSEKED